MKIVLKKVVAVALSIVTAVYAYPVECVPGGLESSLSGQNLASLTSLTVTGSMDARDFRFLQSEMPGLSALDLSGVDVAEYSGKKPLFGNYVSFEKDELPPFCFAGMRLRSVSLPRSLVSVGDGAFSGCAQLRGVEIPANVVSVGDMAFSGCSSLETVKSYSGLVEVGEYAFSKCSMLSSVDLPSLAHIGSSAFSFCASLKSFVFTSSLVRIADGAFEGAGLESVDLSMCNSLTEIGAWAFADNGSLRSVVLPSGLESLGDGAFFYNTALGSIDLPEGVVRINDFTFAGNKLMADSKFLPASLKDIGDYALSDWRSLVEIIIPENVEYIGTGAFRNQSSLRRIEALPADPPSLGDDVWENVAKWRVDLIVPGNSEIAYRAAEQWMDFFNASASVNFEEALIKAAVADGNLVLESSDVITEAALYSVNGTLLSVKRPQSEAVDFYLGGYTGSLYVVRCVLDNGKVEILKIVRD